MRTLLHTQALTAQECRMLDEIQKVELDWMSSISEATRKGTEKGFEEGIDKGTRETTLAIALELLQNGC